MERIVFAMPKITSTGRKTDMAPIDTLDDARRCIIAAGGPREWNDTRESWLARAAWRLGITAGRATSIFYRKVSDLPAREYLELVQRAAALEQSARERRESIETLRSALLALDSRASRSGEPVGHAESGTDHREAGEPR